MALLDKNRPGKTFPASPALREREERLEALKALVSQLGHDFNNFLVPFLGYVTLVREETSPESTVAQYLSTMENSARKTEQYLETVMLAVKPARRFSPKPGDFRALLEQVLASWSSGLTPSPIRLTTDLQPCSLVFDEDHWRNAIQQVLNNARMALAMGGNLQVRLHKKPLPPERASEIGVDDSEVFELVFEDNGIGMSEETLRRACEPFFTTRPKGKALGLGLTIVHSVARLHGGQLLIESQEDAGAKIQIILPAINGPKPKSESGRASTPSDSSGQRKQTRRVLLVEDDPFVREIVKNFLQRMSLEVYMAADGVEGLKLFQKLSHDLCLIVSDITMPQMDGIEFYRNVRKLDPAVRVLLISGDAEASREDALASLGSERPILLKKPFTMKQFTEIVRSQLG
ncbi:MAG: response regulator [Verrucomicrobiota bacterium]